MTNAAITNSRLSYEQVWALYEQLLSDVLHQAHQDVLPITSYLANITGKGLRARLLLLSAMGDDNLIPAAAASLAVGVELLHLATLVHDDVIDDAQTRRGYDSVHQKFGKRHAVLCGDYLLCVSFATIARVGEQLDLQSYEKEGKQEFFSYFASLTSKICLGEIKQHQNNKNFDLTVPTYLRIIFGKTAALFTISAHGGALLGNRSEREIRKLSRFGRYLGMMFQIVDDCKDYLDSTEEALKPVQNDIRQGVVTLPLIFAMAKDQTLQHLAWQVVAGERDASTLAVKVGTAGGVRQALQVGESYGNKARALLLGLRHPQKEKKLHQLMQLAGDLQRLPHNKDTC